jgi:hypothetical protein
MEISIPVGAAGAELAGDGSHQQRWARAAAKREARLYWFVCFVALGESVGNAFGTLSFLWATMVLLGGFYTALNQEDFWFPMVMIFIESFRCVVECSSLIPYFENWKKVSPVIF